MGLKIIIVTTLVKTDKGETNMQYIFEHDYPKEAYFNLTKETRDAHYAYFSHAFEEACRSFAIQHNSSIEDLKTRNSPCIGIEGCVADMVYLLINDHSAYDEKAMYLINRCYDMENRLALQQRALEQGEELQDGEQEASQSYKLKLQFFKHVKQQLEFINSRIKNEHEPAEY